MSTRFCCIFFSGNHNNHDNMFTGLLENHYIIFVNLSSIQQTYIMTEKTSSSYQQRVECVDVVIICFLTQGLSARFPDSL